MDNLKPEDFFNLALVKINEKLYLEAIDLFSKAERNSPNGKCPEASYNKGLVFFKNLKKHKKAIDSFTKAENDSLDGKDPEASYKKGLIFHHIFKKYKKAIESFTKAEKDSPDGKYPSASYNKGILFSKHLQKYNKAIDSFTKAESDSLKGKFPKASYNKGILFSEYFKKYNKAIDSFTKAESDSLKGKFPKASFSKGFMFLEYLQKYNKAVEAFTKAENDASDGKYPKASFNKGFVFYKFFKNYNKSIASFTKAEKDSPDGKLPMASSNKGHIYFKFIKNYNKAYSSFQKVIKDSSIFDDTLKRSYIGKSKCLFKFHDYESSRKALDIVLNEDSRFEEAFYCILDFFPDPRTKPIYLERLQYLAIYLGIASKQAQNLKTDFGAHTYLRINNKKCESQFIFLCLNERIKFDNIISEKEKLTLAYLVAFTSKLYANSFYIIDELIDGEFDLSDCDKFFYLSLAYLIGEPKKELEYYISLVPESDSGFGKAFTDLSNDIKVALQKNILLDSYLLDVKPLTYLPKTDYTQIGSHYWINDCLKTIVFDSEYVLPITDQERNGLFVRLVLDFTLNKIDINEYKDNDDWKNFIRSVNQNSFDSTQISNITKAIEKGASYMSILNVLFTKYAKSTDKDELHNIAILQSVTITYSKALDRIRQGGYIDQNNTILSFFGELALNSYLGNLVQLGLLSKLGIALAVSKITTLFTSMIIDKITLKNQIEKFKKQLK